MRTSPEKLAELAELLKTMPEYLEEKRRKREERAAFVEEVFGEAWRTLQKRLADIKSQESKTVDES